MPPQTSIRASIAVGDRRVLDRILIRSRRRASSSERRRAAPPRRARDRVRDQRHAQLVGAGLDRDAALRVEAAARSDCSSATSGTCSPTGPASSCPSTSRSIAPADSELEQEPVDGEIAGARREIRVERRGPDQVAQLRRARRLRSAAADRAGSHTLASTPKWDRRAKNGVPAGMPVGARRMIVPNAPIHACGDSRAQMRQFAQARVGIDVRRARHARGDQSAVGQHVGRDDEGVGPAIRRLAIEPPNQRVGTPGFEESPEQRVRRRVAPVRRRCARASPEAAPSPAGRRSERMRSSPATQRSESDQSRARSDPPRRVEQRRAPSRRRRPRRSMTIATLTRPSAASINSAAARVRRPPANSAIMRSARARSFAFDATRSTIRLSCTFPKRTITAVEIALSAIFCAVPAFMRVDPASASAPVSKTIAASAVARERRIGDAVSASVYAPSSRARFDRRRPRKPRLRSPRSRSTASSPFAHAPHQRRAGLTVVFGAFDRTRYRRRTAGDMRAHQLGRRSKRRRHLGRIEHGEPPAAPGADVVQRAAARRRAAIASTASAIASVCARTASTAVALLADEQFDERGRARPSRDRHCAGCARSVEGRSALIRDARIRRRSRRATSRSSYGAIAPRHDRMRRARRGRDV